jgi:hypothetical protein
MFVQIHVVHACPFDLMYRFAPTAYTRTQVIVMLFLGCGWVQRPESEGETVQRAQRH